MSHAAAKNTAHGVSSRKEFDMARKIVKKKPSDDRTKRTPPKREDNEKYNEKAPKKTKITPLKRIAQKNVPNKKRNAAAERASS